MRTIFLSGFIILISLPGVAQTEHWDTYIARWAEGPGSVSLNMALINVCPKSTMPFVIVTGVTYKNCREDGFPLKGEFENLYKISDAVNALVAEMTVSEHAGTFTIQCERLDYIYVKDTVGIREKLAALYSTNFKDYKYYTNIKPDQEWKAYTEFLYPDEETFEYMANEKVIDNLLKSGDDLSKARQVDHWLYFATVKQRDAFLEQIKPENFKVEAMQTIKENKLPFQLHISRVDSIEIRSISLVTINLRKIAKSHSGYYDGWETYVVK